MTQVDFFTEVLNHGGENPTEILVGNDLLAAPEVVERLRHWLEGRTVFVLSTPLLERLHGGALHHLTSVAERRVDLSVEDGEGAKTLDHAGRLWREMLLAGGKRDSRLIAFGGGTVGDLAGFVAGCFLRGIEVVQVPTTLLAQVDASIGGKTAIDLPEGKNTVGVFLHPRWVLSDTRLLTTLPRREIRAGLVEAIKKAALLDVDLLTRIETDLDALLTGQGNALAEVVRRAASAKSRVVEADEREGGWRQVLNYGHTLGHAIEGALGYGDLLHGEAVAYGILFANRLARRRGLGGALPSRMRRLLERLELPPLPPLAVDDLLAFAGRDKKARRGGLTWVLPEDLGKPCFVDDLGWDEVAAEIGSFLADPWSEGAVSAGPSTGGEAEIGL